MFANSAYEVKRHTAVSFRYKPVRLSSLAVSNN